MFSLPILLAFMAPANILHINLGGAFQQVSVGIFDHEGFLVRTLIANANMAAGAHDIAWDGTTDSGNPATDGPFSAKVLTGNLQPRWAGALYSGSTYAAGSHSLTGYGGILGFQQVRGGMLVERTYNEGPEFLNRITNETPNVFSLAGMPSTDGFGTNYIPTCIAGDDSTIFVGFAPSGIQAESHQNAGFYAFNASTGAPRKWPTVEPVEGFSSRQNGKGRLRRTETPDGKLLMPTSITVQREGNVLALASHDDGVVQCFDKATGRTLPALNLDVPGVACIRFSKDDAVLWVGAEAHLLRFKLSNGKWQKQAPVELPALCRAIAVDQRSGRLAVACAGASQQVLLFTASGDLIKPLGQKGGYETGPEVTDLKWSFSPPDFNRGYGEGLGFDEAGKLWVNDPGNYRALRLDVDSAKVDARISHLSANYVLAIDPTEPERVFVGCLEFRRHWTVPIDQPGAYELVRNWGGGTATGERTSLAEVVTAKNGRTYAATWQSDNGGHKSLVELTPQGIRPISESFPYDYLDADMSVWWSSSDRAIGQVSHAPLDSFDPNGNPVWGKAEIYARPPKLSGDPFSQGLVPMSGIQTWQTTPDGHLLCVSHATDATSRQWFLGQVAHGGSAYNVRTAPGDPTDPLPYPRLGHVPVGGSYTVAGARTLGDLTWLFIGGEGWYSGEACQNLLYHSSGLPVWHGGTSFISGLNYASGNGRAGNPYGNGIVRDANGVIHVLMTSEAGAGPEEWTITNVDTLTVTEAPFVNGVASITVQGGQTAPKPATRLFEDTFQRPDSPSVGNGWTDPNAKWKVVANRLTQKEPDFANYLGSELLRPTTLRDCVQTLDLDSPFDDPSHLWSNGTNTFGNWGLLARKQASGARFFGQLRYSGNVAHTYASVIFSIGFFDEHGKEWTLSADQLTSPPPRGHRYRLQLSVTGTGRTTLSADLLDLTTGTTLMHVDGVCDEPNLQGSGRCGLFGGWQHTRFGRYTLAQ